MCSNLNPSDLIQTSGGSFDLPGELIIECGKLLPVPLLLGGKLRTRYPRSLHIA